MPDRTQDIRPWHAEPLGAIHEALGVSPSGLSATQAQQRLVEYGRNQLPEKGPPPLWLIVFKQFVSPLVYILVAAAEVSAVIGDVKDAGFIAVVLAINAGIGAYQEAQAEKSSQALRKLLTIHAQVERDGELHEVRADEVVPGDVVWLESGNRVPADIRLLSAQGLEIDESLLTGESLAVHKNAEWFGTAETPLADRQNMAFALIGLGGFGVFKLALSWGWSVPEARNLLLLVMVLFENFHIGNCRSETRSAFALSPLRSPVLFFGTLGAFFIHIAGMYVPFLQDILATSPVSPSMWLVAIAVSVLIVPAIELHKWCWSRREPQTC